MITKTPGVMAIDKKELPERARRKSSDLYTDLHSMAIDNMAGKIDLKQAGAPEAKVVTSTVYRVGADNKNPGHIQTSFDGNTIYFWWGK